MTRISGISTEDTAPAKTNWIEMEQSGGTDVKVKRGYLSGLSIQTGVLENGKISVTVSSNNITLALKTPAGDPSSTDPVFAWFNGTRISATAPLSVTKAAGTNWFNSGSAELATQTISYFAYLGYNGTDGMVIGFARIPSAKVYSDFSVTSTNEKYAAISTITNATANDEYQVIGRFDATLSAGAGYTWSVPAFTASNLIQRPIYETGWLTWAPTSAGFSANPTDVAEYKVVLNGYWINVRDSANGTSNSGTYTKTLPFTSKTVTNQRWLGTAGVTNNGVALTTASAAQVTSNSNSLEIYIDMAAGGFVTSGTKGLRTLTPILIEL